MTMTQTSKLWHFLIIVQKRPKQPKALDISMSANNNEQELVHQTKI